MNKCELATKAGKHSVQGLVALGGDHRVAVGLSGGVDSSITAALLVKAGWEVDGLTLWLMSGKGSCCSDGLVDAAGICKQLEIPHHVVDSRDTFKKEIINGLIEGYQQGITPLPCSRCNRSVKFSTMLNWAKENLNTNRIATGHYARISYGNKNSRHSKENGSLNNRNQLLRGIDPSKDQSYFLYDLPQSLLANIIFPLGELTKEESRKEASNFGLRTAQKPESQDLCLAEHHGSMKSFIDHYLKPREGEVVLMDGTIIGHHDGIEHFTIGQRKGLGVSWKEPLYVTRIEAESNRIIVAARQEAGRSNCTVGNINWVSINPPSKKLTVEVQIRYKSKPVLAELTPIMATDADHKNKRPYRCSLEFKEELFSITPGQAAVFYAGEMLLGGGIIQPFL